MNLEKALTIQGWMAEDELAWLAEQASSHKRIVEIGSWKGRSTRAMADNLSEGGMLVAVDTWVGSDEEAHNSELKVHEGGWLLNEFRCNMAGTNSLNLMPLQTTSLEAAHLLVNTRFDMIFLDAAHDYENVKADIAAWKPLLADGGLFCGHDYNGSWVGVKRAVDEAFSDVKSGAGAIWYL